MSFKRFDTEDIVVSAESVTTPLWTGDTTQLNTFYTSSTQIGGTSADYYYDIYQSGFSSQGLNRTAQPEFLNMPMSPAESPMDAVCSGKTPSRRWSI